MPKRGQKHRPEPAGSRPLVISNEDLHSRGRLIGFVAAALGVLLYLNTVGHQYTLDDFSSIKGNWIVKQGLTAESVGLILTTEYRHGAWNSPGSLYRPIPLIMFAAEWQIAPDDPRLGRVINILLYGLTGWLLWITLRRVLIRQPLALVAATVLLFMAHPIHTEVVANTKSRDEILSFLFGISALYSVWRYLDGTHKGWLVSFVFLYALALFSKESAITLIAVFPITIWFFRDEDFKTILKIGMLMILPAALYLMIRHAILAAQSGPEIYSALDTVYMATDDALERIATAFMMCGYYLKALLFPHPLVSEMGYPQVTPVGFTDPRAVAGFAAMLGLGSVGLAGLRRKRAISYAVLFFLCTFSLFSNLFIIIGTSYGERLLYLPSLGSTMALVLCLAHLTGMTDTRSLWRGKHVTVFWSVFGLALVLFAVRTVTRNKDWYNSGTLYAADLPHAPNSAKLNFHNGIEVIKKGMVEETGMVKDTSWVMAAIASYTKAIQLYPEHDPDAYHARGQAWLRLGRYELAEPDLRKAIEQRKSYGEAYSNLGVIRFHQKEYQEAEVLFREAIHYDSKLVDAHRNLGAVLATQRRFPEAIMQWEQGLEHEPFNATLLNFISSAYKDMGQQEKAAYWNEQARTAAQRASRERWVR